MVILSVTGSLFSTFIRQYSRLGTFREAKFSRIMAKMLARGSGKPSKRKKNWYLQPSVVTKGTSVADYKVKSAPIETRRMKQVSSVLYRYVSEIVSSGELDPNLMTVDISKVSISNDFGSLNIYWFVTGQADDDLVTESLLRQNAGKLRTKLVNLRLISHAPKIHFLQDETEANVNKVEELLRIADFGPDYEPQDTLQRARNFAKTPQQSHDIPASGKDRFEKDFQNPMTQYLNDINSESDLPPDEQLKLNTSGSNLSKIISDRLSKKTESVAGTLYTNDNSSIELKSGSVYGLNRDEMVSKIIAIKKKSIDRSYDITEGGVLDSKVKTLKSKLKPKPNGLDESKKYGVSVRNIDFDENSIDEDDDKSDEYFDDLDDDLNDEKDENSRSDDIYK